MLSREEFDEKTKDSRFFNLAGVDVWLFQAISGKDEEALLRLIHSSSGHLDKYGNPYITDYYVFDDNFDYLFFLCRQDDSVGDKFGGKK